MLARRAWSPLLLFLVPSFVVALPRPRFTIVCQQRPSKGPAAPDRADDALYAVSVTPKGGDPTVQPNTSGNQVTFTVTNEGTCPDTYFLTAHYSGQVTGVSLSPTQLSLSAGSPGYATATFSVGGDGSGVISLEASGTAYDTGYYNVTVGMGSPIISVAPDNQSDHDVTKCVAACFDAVSSYSTPPYYSWDTPHSVTLVYRSANAHPFPTVQVNAWDTTSVYPTKMSITLKNSLGAVVGGENFYGCSSTGGSYSCDSTWNRLAVQFDATGLTTGAYTYTVAIRSYRSSGASAESDVPVRVLIENEITSPFGAGWTIDGLQHVSVQGDGSLVITEGNGSILYFQVNSTNCTSPCSYTSPAGDFTTVTSVTASPEYKRVYPDGTVYWFFSNGQLAYVQDRFQNQTTYGWNGSLLTSITDTALKVYALAYGSGLQSNQLQWIRDPGGRTDSITIDSSGDLTQIKDWAGGLPFQGVYGTSNHVLQTRTDRRGGTWSLSYDSFAKLASVTAPQITANGSTQSPVTTYTSWESAVLPSSGYGGSGNPAPGVNGNAARAKVTNPNGFATAYALDRFGEATRIEQPLGRTTRITFDTSGRAVVDSSPRHLIRRTWTGPIVTQWHDSLSGRTITYQYDSHYNLLTSTTGDVDSVINVVVDTGADAFKVVDSTRMGGATVVMHYTYLANGWGQCALRMKSGSEYATTCRYPDGGGFRNTDSVRTNGVPQPPPPNAALAQTYYQYDGHGQRTVTIDPERDTTQTKYDSIGRVSQTIGPRHDATTYTYDGLYLTQVQDALGQVYRVWPNALGWPDSTTDPAGTATRFTYDLNGNRTNITNRRGQPIQFTYDSLDQLRTRIVGTDTTKYYTDPLGAFQTAANRESVDTVKVDSAGRPFAAISCRVIVTMQCFRDSSVYSVRDQRLRITWTAPLSSWAWGPYTANFFYDAHSLLDTLTTYWGEKVTFTYRGDLRDSTRTFLSYGNGTLQETFSHPQWVSGVDGIQFSDTTINRLVGTTASYDSVGRTTGAYQGPEGAPDTVRTATFDPGSRLVQYGDTAYMWSPDTACALGPLGVRAAMGETCNRSDVSSTNPLSRTTYTYDVVGNPMDSTTQSYAVSPGNRLTRWRNYRMAYDADGNLSVKRVLKADTTKVTVIDSLWWSATGQLDSLHYADSTGHVVRINYGYDASGRRVRKWFPDFPGSTVRYLWEGDEMAFVLDSLGRRSAYWTYYPGTNDPAYVTTTSTSGVDTTLYYATDAQHNTVGLIESNYNGGFTLRNQYRYAPFGDSLVTAGPGGRGLQIQYKGAFYEPQLYGGFYTMGARLYDRNIGRFISEDPADLQAGINRYAFAGNDPINGYDPSGQFNVLRLVPGVVAFAAVFAADVLTLGAGTPVAVLAAAKTVGEIAAGSAAAAGIESEVTGRPFLKTFERDFDISSCILIAYQGLPYAFGALAGAAVLRSTNSGDPAELQACLASCEAGAEAVEEYCRSVSDPRARALCWGSVLAGEVACKGICYAIHSN